LLPGSYLLIPAEYVQWHGLFHITADNLKFAGKVTYQHYFLKSNSYQEKTHYYDRDFMSRGFVREGDQEEVPLVPQRAYLPAGVANFVTREGMDLLLKEKEELIKEKETLGITDENEKRIAENYLNAKLQLLNERIAEARVVEITGQPPDEITFGVTVTLKAFASGNVQTFKIVGVDEADIARGKISFISPLAKVLINKKTGDRVTLKRGKEDIVFEIVEIAYR
jgi:transcription elongation factor GreB